MIKLAANLSMMFQDLPFLERFGAAASAGFKGVEYLFPYVEPAARIRDELTKHGLQQVLFNTPAGDWAAGDRGTAGNPDRIAECREGIDLAVEYAADAAAKHGVNVLLEAINSKVDMPGYIVDGSAVALDVIDRAGRENLRFQFDIYHMQIMEGDLARSIERLLPRIAHIQLADNPGRHEPGTGEINYAWLLNKIDALGYAGWVGCEYRPVGDTNAGLAWARPYLRETEKV